MPTREQMEAVVRDIEIWQGGLNVLPIEDKHGVPAAEGRKLLFWAEMTEHYRRHALASEIDWEGFTESEKDNVIRRVLDGQPAESSMDGITASLAETDPSIAQGANRQPAAPGNDYARAFDRVVADLPRLWEQHGQGPGGKRWEESDAAEKAGFLAGYAARHQVPFWQFVEAASRTLGREPGQDFTPEEVHDLGRHFRRALGDPPHTLSERGGFGGHAEALRSDPAPRLRLALESLATHADEECPAGYRSHHFDEALREARAVLAATDPSPTQDAGRQPAAAGDDAAPPKLLEALRAAKATIGALSNDVDLFREHYADPAHYDHGEASFNLEQTHTQIDAAIAEATGQHGHPLAAAKLQAGNAKLREALTRLVYDAAGDQANPLIRDKTLQTIETARVVLVETDPSTTPTAERQPAAPVSDYARTLDATARRAQQRDPDRGIDR
jgi:hypothetical protein